VPKSSSRALTEVTQIVEREYRFIPAERLPRAAVTPPRWHGYAILPLPTEEQRNTYLDTPDVALARQGVSFRRRELLDPTGRHVERAELTLKLSRAATGSGLFARPEYTEPIAPGESMAGHPLLAMAEGLTASRPIGTWFAFQTHREGVALRQPGATIYLTWDTLSLPGDPDFADKEIEAELVDGPDEALHALARLLTDTYDLRIGDAGKRTRVGRYLARRGLIAFPGITPWRAISD
jgi:inorganic triphosphatase YgiF